MAFHDHSHLGRRPSRHVGSGDWVCRHQPQRGVLKEWTLMLHGTQSAPYIDQIVKDYQSKLAMSKKEELEEELDEAVERSLKSILSKN